MPNLLKNFKPVLLLFISLVLAATAVMFMLAARHESVRAMSAAGEQSANNVLDALMLDIESQSAEYVFFKRYALERYKRRLEEVSGVVSGILGYYYRAEVRSQADLERAKANALEAVKDLRYGNNDYFFIYDRNNVCISHPNPAMIGRDMSGFLDTRGKPLISEAWTDTAGGKGHFDHIQFPRLGEEKEEPKLVYFRRIESFDWLLGAGVYVDDIDQDLTRKKAETIRGLRKILKNIRIAKTGTVWLFTGDGEVLAHPEIAGDTRQNEKKARESGLFDKLIKTAGTDGKLHYIWDSPEDPGNFVHPKEAWVRYFKPLDWYLAATVYEEELAAPAAAMLRRQSLYLCGILVLCLAGGWLFAAKVTGPLTRLSRHASELAANDFAVSKEEAKVLPELTFPNEIKALAATIGEMEVKLGHYLDRLTETTTAKERIHSELRIAHRIQMDMLPGPPPRLSPWTVLELHALLTPAKEVGGDLYDYFTAGDGRICLVVGDVSGKGVPAALFMAQCKALARGFAQQGLTPGGVLARMDAELSQGNAECMFVTLFLAVVDPATGEFEYANAGHNPPLILGANGRCAPLDVTPGAPLGVELGIAYPTQRHALMPGETLFIYTDGVSEAQNKAQKLFTVDKLTQVLRQSAALPVRDIAEAVLGAVEAHEAGADRADDITMLAVRYLGGKA